MLGERAKSADRCGASRRGRGVPLTLGGRFAAKGRRGCEGENNGRAALGRQVCRAGGGWFWDGGREVAWGWATFLWFLGEQG